MGFLKFMKKREGAERSKGKSQAKPEMKIKNFEDLPPLPPLERLTAMPRKEPSLPKLPTAPSELKSPFEEKKKRQMPEELKIPDFPDIKKLKEIDEDKLAEMFPSGRETFDQEELLSRETMQHELARIHEKEDIKEKISPLFIKISGFNSVIGDIDFMKNEIKSGTAMLDKLNEIKNEQDKHFSEWRSNMKEIERKLMYIDRVIFETKHY